MSGRRGLEALLAQLDAMRAQIGAMLDAPEAELPDEYVDGRSAHELGLTRRSFLYYANSGAFPTFLRGNKKVARRADVVAWSESRKAPTRPLEEERGDDIDAKIAKLLDRGRLRPVAGGRR